MVLMFFFESNRGRKFGKIIASASVMQREKDIKKSVYYRYTNPFKK